MCDLADGQVILGRPHSGPAAAIASAAIEAVAGRHHSLREASLGELLGQAQPPVWNSGIYIHEPPARHELPFAVELMKVPLGAEVSFVDELRVEYLARVLDHPTMVATLAADPNLRLAASPNWRLHQSKASDQVTEPFKLGSNHSSYLTQVGLDTAKPGEASGITVAYSTTGSTAPSGSWRQPPFRSARGRTSSLATPRCPATARS